MDKITFDEVRTGDRVVVNKREYTVKAWTYSSVTITADGRNLTVGRYILDAFGAEYYPAPLRGFTDREYARGLAQYVLENVDVDFVRNCAMIDRVEVDAEAVATYITGSLVAEVS